MNLSARRALTTACLAGLSAAGLGLYAVTRVWRQTEHARMEPLPPETVTQTGAELAVWSVPAGAVALAGVLAFLATTHTARRIVTVCVALSGVGLATAGIQGVWQHPGLWPATTVACGVAVVGVAGWMLRKASVWPGMSARYDRQRKPDAIADDPTAIWDALDRGDDLTSLSIGQTAPGEECAR